MVNFNGINNLKRIAGRFLVSLNNALVDFHGFDNLSVIAGYDGASITDNNNLTSLDGLDSLTCITRALLLSDNPRLTSIEALTNMTNTLTWIYIYYNDSLKSLDGLNNFTVSYINRLEIHDNYMLSDCATPSICHYLSDPESDYEIYGNEIGCNTINEILQACESLTVEEEKQGGDFRMYPNPLSEYLSIELMELPGENTKLSIYSSDSRNVVEMEMNSRITLIDISDQPKGIYFIRLTGEKSTQIKKFIKY